MLFLIVATLGLNASYVIQPPTTPSPITPSLGTPKFIQAAEAHAIVGLSSLTVSFGSTPVVGDIVVVIGLTANSGASTTDLTLVMTDNQGAGNGNGYSRLQINLNATGNVGRVSMWCAPVTTSTGTFTITETASSAMLPGIFALEYSGTSCNMDKFAITSGATSPYSCGSITTVNPKDLVLAVVFAVAATGTTTFTGPTNFTIRKSQADSTIGNVASVADDIVSTTGTFAPTYGTGQNHAQTPCTVAALVSQ